MAECNSCGVSIEKGEEFEHLGRTLCEDRYLYFRAARVILVAGVLFDNLRFRCGINRHNISLLLSDIGNVEAPYNLGCTSNAFHQRHRGFAQFRQIEPIALGHPGKDPALTDRTHPRQRRGSLR